MSYSFAQTPYPRSSVVWPRSLHDPTVHERMAFSAHASLSEALYLYARTRVKPFIVAKQCLATVERERLSTEGTKR